MLPLRYLLLLLPLLTPLAHAESRQPTHSYTLDNGLKVIIREDHRAPVVVSQVWYKVGGVDEPPGQTGLSHALEHMMFKGSEHLEPGQASHLLSSLGASENAMTSRDYTAYYQMLSRDQLPVALELEAERMHLLTLPEDEFIKEIEVIKEERRMRVDDNPNGLAYERFLAQAYTANPYRQPVIGWMHDIERMSIEDLRAWYKQHYVPGNAVLVIVGDVYPETVKPLVERYFGAVPAGAKPVVRTPLELPAPGERSMTLHLDLQLPTLLMGFNVPSLNTASEAWEVHALRLLGAVLDGGYSARLPSHLERGQAIATSVGTGYDAFTRGDSLFVFSGIPNEARNIDLPQLEEAIWQEIDELKQNPPSEDELARVQAQVVAGLVYAQDSIMAQANRIGELEVVGLSWELVDEDTAALQAITPEQISEVARRYLVRDRLTRSYNLPLAEEAQP
ncbi:MULTISPECIES: M16 family metallopeptidase [Pseudomonas]|uniref:Peptidase M16 n=1 Tax=Pseudomonas abyssi TaxID=170540 RepID=A0A395QZC0_9PSED|nr:pitrilysin family protein [Halopseudomonas gallaeciensis]MAG66185.1 peptidase M16 [Pseudomonadales bacterium]RGP52842.1 peptidase M16 [Halopseudomonas gallaeciensis]|tara:strand:+ start:1741 stop:3087 length:1347 start_codon:yes stop_codon:yes gene_type:complete